MTPVDELREAARQMLLYAETDSAGDKRAEAVALAVASLLGREVHVAEVMAREHSDLPYQPDQNVLAVARAYLGQPVMPARNEATRWDA